MVEIATLPFLSVIVYDLLKDTYDNLKVSQNYCPSKGTDIIVYSNNQPLLKMEVLNWWIDSILPQKRANGIRDNLEGVRFKVLYVPSELNFRSKTKKVKPASLKSLDGIDIYYSGYQILPKTYFEYFENLDSRFILFRAVHGKNTINHQKSRLKRFFEDIGLIYPS